MRWPKLIVLVRHAEAKEKADSLKNTARFLVSPHERRITERGRRQAEITGEYLRERFGVFDRHYISHYARAEETLSILCPEASPYEDSRIGEVQRGIFQTMSEEAISERFPEELTRRDHEGVYDYRPIGGENWPDGELRVHSFLETLRGDSAGKSVLIVSHGHCIILFRKIVERLSIETALRLEKDRGVENASIVAYRGTDRNSRLTLADYIIPWEGKLDMAQ